MLDSKCLTNWQTLTPPSLETLVHVDSSHLIPTGVSLVAPITTTVLQFQSSCGDRIRSVPPSPVSKLQWDRHELISKGKTEPRLHRQGLPAYMFVALNPRDSLDEQLPFQKQEEGGRTAADVAMASTHGGGRKRCMLTHIHLACRCSLFHKSISFHFSATESHAEETLTRAHGCHRVKYR